MLELELQADVSHLTLMLRAELGPSIQTQYALFTARHLSSPSLKKINNSFKAFIG